MKKVNEYYIISFLLIIFMFLNVTIVFATNYIWDGGAGTNKWEDGGNWDPNAPAGGPGAGDNVTINYTGATVYTPSDVSVTSLTIGTSLLCSLTLGGNLTISQNLNISSAGTLNCGSYDLIVTGNIINSGNLNTNKNISCSNFTSTNSFTHSTGTTTISCSGDVNISGTFNHNDSTILSLNGENKVLNSTSQLCNVKITGGTIILNNNLTMKDLEITNGNFIVSKNLIVDNITVASGGTLKLNGSSNSVTILVSDGKVITNSGTIQVLNSSNEVKITSSGTANFTGKDIDYNGLEISLANLNIEPTVVLSSGEKINLKGNCSFNDLILMAGASFTQGGNNNLTINGDLNIDPGATFTKDTGTGKIVFNKNGTQYASINNKDLGKIEIGSLTTLRLSGQINVDSVTVYGILELDGASSSGASLNLSNGGSIANNGIFRVYNSTNTVTLKSLGTATFDGNSIELNGKTLHVKGINFLNSVVLDSTEQLILDGSCSFYELITSTSTARVNQGSNNNITITENLVLMGGTFIKDTGSGLIIFNDSGYLNVGGNNIGNVQITTSGTIVTINSNLKADSITIDEGAKLYCSTASLVISIAAGGILTNNGTFELAGTTGSEITLNSENSGSPFYLNDTALGNVVLSKVKIKDCNAIGDTIDATNNCINLGGNTNVNFSPVVWTGISNNYYSNPSNWSTNSVPTGGDSVIFSGSNNCIINIPAEVVNFTVQSSYSGTITLNSTLTINGNMEMQEGTSGVLVDNGKTIICKGNWVKNGGTVNLTGNLIMAAQTGIKTITSNGSSFYNLTFNDNAGNATFQILDALSVTNNLIISDGIVDFNSKPVTVGGSFENNGGSFITGTQTTTFNANSGSKNIISNGSSFNNVVFNGVNATFLIQDSFVCLGDFTITKGTVDVVDGENNSITISGNFTNNDTFLPRLGTIIFNKGGIQSITGIGVNLNTISIIGNGTNLNVNSNIGFKDLNINSNTSFNCNTSNVTIKVEAGGTINVNGSLTLAGGGAGNEISFISSSSGSSFNLNNQGSVSLSWVKIKDCNASNGQTVNATNYCSNLGGNSNLIFSAVRWIGGSNEYFSNPSNWNTGCVPLSEDSVEFNSGSNNCILDIDAHIKSMVVAGFNGIIQIADGKTLTVDGPITLATGKLEAGNGKIVVKGNFSSLINTFSAGGSTLEFESSGSLVLGGNPLNYLVIRGSQTIVELQDNLYVGDISILPYAELKCLKPSTTISIQSGKTVTVDGTLTLMGEVGKEIKLCSSNELNTFKIKVNGTASFYGVEIKDCDATSGKKINATNNCIDKGNNFNITFETPLILAGSGGTVECISNPSTKIVIQPNALNKDAKVSIVPLALPNSKEIGFEVSAVSISDGLNIKSLTKPADLTIPYDSSGSIFYHNGIEWIKLGGVYDTTNKTISVKTNMFGKYKAKASSRSEEFTLTHISPSKIFTPNNDGVYDEIEFYIDNPTDSQVTAKIYNIAGKEIADMKLSPTGTNYYWDGKDKDGNIVESGIYIYQFKVEGKVINGTVVVAR